jgi:hypothetical protein
MADYDPLQLDAAFTYVRGALTATYRELSQTHGEAFAAFFLSEYMDQVLQAAKTRLCGLAEVTVVDATRRLRGESKAL